MNGIDVSHHQGPIDWIAVRNSGISFAFVKASEGLSCTDPMFRTNWANAHNAGILRGAYHFFRPGSDPQQQAAHFLAQLGTDPGELPPVLDIELLDGVAPAEVIARAGTCLHSITSALIAPILYTGTSFWRDTLKNSASLAKYPLWIAHYTHALSPTVPRPWSTWTFWQHSQEGRIPGIAGNVDLNRCNGEMLEKLQVR
jgi:lysozyme